MNVFKVSTDPKLQSTQIRDYLLFFVVTFHSFINSPIYKCCGTFVGSGSVFLNNFPFIGCHADFEARRIQNIRRLKGTYTVDMVNRIVDLLVRGNDCGTWSDSDRAYDNLVITIMRRRITVSKMKQ